MHQAKTISPNAQPTDVTNYASGGTKLAQSKYDYDDNGRQTPSRRKDNPGGADDDAADFLVKSFYDITGILTKWTSASSCFQLCGSDIL